MHAFHLCALHPTLYSGDMPQPDSCEAAASHPHHSLLVPMQQFSGGCVYGNWCGSNCTGTGGDPIDNLDQACQEHDNCLAGADSCHACACDKALLDKAVYVS